jgi:hypothetical protein
MGSSRRRFVEPVNPFEGGELDGLEGTPQSAPMDQLDLEETDDDFSKGIVVRIADTADRGFDAGLGEPLRVADRHVLGGFKWSSQHPEVGGCNEHSKVAVGLSISDRIWLPTPNSE